MQSASLGFPWILDVRIIDFSRAMLLLSPSASPSQNTVLSSGQGPGSCCVLGSFGALCSPFHVHGWQLCLKSSGEHGIVCAFSLVSV